MSDQVPAWAKNPPPFPEDPSEVDHVVEIIAQQLNESCQIGKAIHSGTTSSTAVILREVLRNELANQGMDKKLIYSDDIEKIYIKGSLHIFSSDIDIPYPIHCAHELLMDGIKFLNDALDSQWKCFGGNGNQISNIPRLLKKAGKENKRILIKQGTTKAIN